MNQKIKLIVVSLVLLIIVGINISYVYAYATSVPNTFDFFEVNAEQLASGETVEMTIDLSKINHERFKFVLRSNVEIEKVYAVDDSDMKLDEENNDIVMNIDKEKLNLNKIVLYYQIPEDIELGTKLQLNAQIIISEDNEEKVVDEKQVEITIVEKDDNSEGNQDEDNKKQEDNQDGNNQNPEDNQEENNQNQGDNKDGNNQNPDGNPDVNNKNEENKNLEENIEKERQGNQPNENISKNSNQNSIQDMQESDANRAVSSKNDMQGMGNSDSNAKTSVPQAETATYNGSNNNYLSSLEIEGIELTTDFNKEKLTYFATAEGLETITVTANAEDSSSKIAITGTNLKGGENKVLISVTAENGNVRYYRIYVTNN